MKIKVELRPESEDKIVRKHMKLIMRDEKHFSKEGNSELYKAAKAIKEYYS